MPKTYQEELETLILDHLLPVYRAYYTLLDKPIPEINPLLIATIRKRQPALFKPKT